MRIVIHSQFYVGNSDCKMSSERLYDLVIYGATSFTGKLACKYMAAKGVDFFEKFTWAIAGRSQEKLQQLKSSLSETNSFVESLPVLIADCEDAPKIDEITSNSKVVISFAGPYSKYGSKLVESCVKNGTHYADLTGELFWVAEMIKQHDEQAKANKVTLVPVCGFDSVPSDWGTYAIAKLFKEQLNEETKHVRGIFWNGKGGFSGGTVASGMEMMSPQNIGKSIALLKDPQSLVPEDFKTGLDKPDVRSLYWDKELKQYIGPFAMAPGNSRVVRRTNAFNRYGAKFTYDEMAKFNSYLSGQAITWGTYFAEGFLASQWLRPVANRVVPKPGQGPNEKQLESGFAVLKFFGESAETARKAECTLTINGDPGYKMTARMIVEAGIDLVKESGDKGNFGFLTPASALSDNYYQELIKNGFDIEIKLI